MATDPPHDRSRLVEVLFQGARDLPPVQREVFLDERCATDAALRREVQTLLSGFDAADAGFLQPLGVPGAAPLDEPPLPERVGSYRVLRRVGEGGMGVVYEAQQEHPRRTVAIKLMKPWLVSPETLRRFRFEGQVLGHLQHPGIAQIFEAGSAPLTFSGAPSDPQPFFAMEFVRGEPLTGYAERAGLDRRARLDLLARVCDAVEHAHQRAVIHRDLKPANILVDTAGQPKILDFGIARVLDAQTQTLSLHTSRGELLGTLPYMSPEQLSGDPDAADTRSDVYSLGVILFELLTGALPHDTAGLPFLEAARQIRERDPRRAGSLNRALRGELEAICATALRKEKLRRYQSAAHLAEDLRRCLRGEPVEARRDSALYVLRKTAWRYRWLAVATLLLVLLISLFGVLSSMQARQNRRLAADLGAALAVSDLERGRALGRSGDVPPAEDLLWREHLRAPTSPRTYWALWELYARDPTLATIPDAPSLSRTVAFAPDGSSFATGAEDGVVRVWSAHDFSLLAELHGHQGDISVLRFSPDSALCASGGVDGTVRLWDLGTGLARHVLPGHRGGASALAFSPDGARLVTGAGNGVIRVFDPADATRLARLDAHRQRVTALVFTPDGDTLASASADSAIKLWHHLDAPPFMTLSGHDDAAFDLAFSPDFRSLVSTSRDGTLKVWDLASGSPVRSINAANGSPRFAAWLGDRELLTVGRHRVDRWDLDTAQRRTVLHYSCSDAALSPDATLLATVRTNPAQGIIRVVDLLSAGQIRLGGTSNAGVATISPDGAMIVCGDRTDQVRLWDLASGQVQRSFPCPTARWTGARLDPSGRLLAATGSDAVLRLWTLADHSLLRTYKGVSFTTGQTAAFSPDATLLALVRSDNSVEIRTVLDDTLRARLPAPGQETLSVRFSPDGHVLAVAHRGKRIELWSDTGTHLGALEVGHTPWTVDFRSDGRALAVAGWDNLFQIFDLDTLSVAIRLTELGTVVWGVAYHPTDPRLLASCTSDGAVQLWDLPQRCNLLTLEPFDGFDALSVAFTPDGTTLVAAGSDGSLCAWDLEYYDRHIAGNLEYQIRRQIALPVPAAAADQLRAWAKDVLARPWPRLAPRAAGRAPTSTPPP